ncbi:MAG: RNA 2',3'-cyclic phosphodiesterase [Planctomycetales bacterium]|nr:RNA 2',3'-cyclic phosphodiesterase [Planctomycetales bacterium]
MMQTIRTFVAVDVPPALHKRVSDIIGLLKAARADVKWVDTGILHLTLKFLGDVPNVEIPDVCKVVARACEGVEPFALTLGGVGAFPDVARARTVWIGAHEGTDEMIALQQRIDEALHKLGFPPERRLFHPHLTIGRLRRGGPEQRELSRLIAEQADAPIGQIEIDEVTVYASTLDRTGPSHDPLAHVELRP